MNNSNKVLSDGLLFIGGFVALVTGVAAFCSSNYIFAFFCGVAFFKCVERLQDNV